MTIQRTIVITGASRGIGRATALALAAPGTRLILAARSAPALAETAAAARVRGAEASPVACDVAIEDQVQSLIAGAASSGRLDVVVHSVGGALVGPFEQIELAAWEETLRAQLTSLFLVCKHAAPRMEAGGLLINIASVAARQAFPGWAAYSAAKHGALGFMNAVREELRPRGIRVTSVLPAATDTDLWAGVPGTWNRTAMLRPEDVAAAVAALVNYPPYVTVEELLIGHVAGRL
ncbi:MAG: SDR family NAD(P)-dependent oxidoreductase [Oscillochloridaceae bacterium]|nr:SDR family NAD(P)-dependent oxidoreductase [Chloroflexaceae bacterium]MDW8388871.1 SDR family NAD(P)-dependent oxidoreductase [Oscillochloridaceae bacterium]